MKFLSVATKAAFVETQMVSRNLGHQSSKISRAVSLFSTTTHHGQPLQSSRDHRAFDSRRPSSSRLFSSSGGSEEVQLRNVGKEEMEEIIEDYEEGGREESGYLVLDVRETNEVEFTGKLSPNTFTLPLSIIGQQNVFSLEDDEFEELCGFSKPTPDETLVFSCAAGVRSVHAAQFAAMNGYTQLINYTGGANQWFM